MDLKPNYPLFLFFIFISAFGYAQSLPPQHFHLTAPPWDHIQISNEQLLDVIEATCLVAAKFQNEEGAITDPYLGREHQYSTPYFAYAVGVIFAGGKG